MAGGSSRRIFLAAAGASIAAPAVAVTTRRTYVDGPYGHIHVRIAEPSAPNDKPAIACFHFSPGSGRMFEAILPLLAIDRTVMAFDTPGYGGSDAPSRPVQISDYADALTRALAALGHGPDRAQIDVIGSATGALIAIDLATRRPNWIRRVVMSGVPAFTAAERASFLADVERMAAERASDTAGDFATRQLNDTLKFATNAPPLAQHLAAFADSLAPGDRWHWGELAAAHFPADERLATMAQPVLLFLNPNARAAATKRTPTLLKKVTVLEPPPAGAMAWQIAPDAMAGHVRRFLDAP